MVYFNDLNDLKKLEHRLISFKRKLDLNNAGEAADETMEVDTKKSNINTINDSDKNNEMNKKVKL